MQGERHPVRGQRARHPADYCPQWMELAQRYGLTIYDLQGDQATRPPDMEPAIRGLIEELRPPDH